MAQRSVRLIGQQGARGRFILTIVLLMVTVAWMAVIMVIMAWPHLQAPSIGPEPAEIPPSTLLVHLLLLFGILGVLVSSTFYVGRRIRERALGVLAASMIGLVWGVVTEWYQLYVPGRYATVQDVALGFVGSTTGGFLTLSVLLWRIRARYRLTERKS